MLKNKYLTMLFAAVVALLSQPALAQNPGTGGSVTATIASTSDVNVLVVSGEVTVSAGVVVQAKATYLKVNVPEAEEGKPRPGPVKKVKWKFYKDRNGNGKYDEGDILIDHGTSDGPNYEQSFLLGNLTINRGSDNQRLEYQVEGDSTTITRDTALGGVF